MLMVSEVVWIMTDYAYLYDSSYYGDDLNCNHLDSRHLFWTELFDVTLLPYMKLHDNIGGGLVDRNGQYIDGTGIHSGLGCGYNFKKTDYVRTDTVVFLGLWPNIWGHCLTDNIRRLWVLDNEEFMEAYGKLKFIYIPFGEKKLIPNFVSLLRMIGTDKIELEPVETITRFKKVILPDECFIRRNDGPRSFVKEFGTRFYTSEYKSIIERIRHYGRSHYIENGKKSIYLSARKRSRYNEQGERKLEIYFRNLGYEIIYPEEYSFVEQLNIFLNCSEFASSIGSISHNIVFLNDHTKVCLIPRTAFIPEYQLALDTLHDLKISYIDSTLSVFPDLNTPWTGPNYYIISDQLQKYFGTNYNYKVNKFKFWVFKHLAYSMNEGVRPSEYYKDAIDRYLSNDEIKEVSNSLFFQYTKKIKLWKLISMIVKWLESTEDYEYKQKFCSSNSR